MKAKSLYIIGNGFDSFHGIDSSYSDFIHYLCRVDFELALLLIKCFTSSTGHADNWTCFGENLTYLNSNSFLYHASKHIQNKYVEKPDNHIESSKKVLNAIIERLPAHYTEWALQIDTVVSKRLDFNKNALFLSFNFTDVLESIYSIPVSQIKYIHGKAIDIESKFIFSSNDEMIRQTNMSRVYEEDNPDVIAAGEIILEEHFKKSHLDFELLSENNEEFFNRLSDVEEIFIIGHRISHLDLKYYEAIQSSATKCKKWNIVDMKDKDRRHDSIRSVISKEKILQIDIDSLLSLESELPEDVCVALRTKLYDAWSLTDSKKKEDSLFNLWTKVNEGKFAEYHGNSHGIRYYEKKLLEKLALYHATNKNLLEVRNWLILLKEKSSKDVTKGDYDFFAGEVFYKMGELDFSKKHFNNAFKLDGIYRFKNLFDEGDNDEYTKLLNNYKDLLDI